MKKTLSFLLPAAFVLITLSGCFNFDHAYFQSPYSGNLETYHTIPLRSDSIRSATYASGSFTVGTANERWRDNQFYFTGALHRSHNFGQFQVYYGANASLGKYQVDSMHGEAAPGANSDLINKNVGGKPFGGYGVAGGIGLVIPFGNGSEWRLPELSFTLQKEFGSYLDFRKGLPDTAANTIFRGRVISTLGLGTEIAFKVRHGMIGLKAMGGGALVNPNDQYSGNKSTNYGMIFLSGTLTVVNYRTTCFGQLNAGNSSLGAQIGVQYRLGTGRQH